MESKPIVLGPSLMDAEWCVTDHRPPPFLTSLVLPPLSSSKGEVKHDSMVNLWFVHNTFLARDGVHKKLNCMVA